MGQDLSITDLKGRGIVDTYVYRPGICAVSLESASRFIGLIYEPFAIFEHQLRSLSIPLLQMPIKVNVARLEVPL
jgi:hypothetical protein